jgi:hypothetical protein
VKPGLVQKENKMKGQKEGSFFKLSHPHCITASESNQQLISQHNTYCLDVEKELHILATKNSHYQEAHKRE